MRCSEVIAALIEYLEGEFSAERRDEIERHLEECASCRSERDELVSSWEKIGSYTAPDVRDDFVPALMRKIYAGDPEPAKTAQALPRFMFRPLAPAFASLVVMVLLVTLYVERPALRVTSGTVSVIAPVSDKEIIRDLDVLENADLLNNMEMLGELEVVEAMDESAS